jgi:hypothetical protein
MDHPADTGHAHNIEHADQTLEGPRRNALICWVSRAGKVWTRSLPLEVLAAR